MIRASALFILLLVGGGALTSRAQAGPPRAPEGPGSSLSVILGRPTDRSIALSVLSAADLDARVAYGAEQGPTSATTDVRTVKAGIPTEFELSALEPDTRYDYRLLGPRLQPLAAGSFHTQRAPGREFSFAVQGDSHPERRGKMFDPALYAQTMRNVAEEQPDFHITMGDDFSIERLISQQALSQAAVDQVYARQREYLGAIGHASALFLVNGNHEQAALCNLDGTPDNCAVLAAQARARFFPLPSPNGFYSGDAEQVAHIGLLHDYYAWTWGDALFIVIDPYWHSPTAVDNEAGVEGRDRGERKGLGKKRDLWDVTLGETQYRWLARTLTETKAPWKFVFCHHVLGTGRGGIECAPLGEWGGKDRRGDERFGQQRPSWELPIHPLMAKTGVTIFFQGHDHLFARQELNGIVYQSCPSPADPTYQAFNHNAYRSGDILPNSGHLRVAVSETEVNVSYVRAWLPQDVGAGRVNGETAFHYAIGIRSRSP